MTSFVPPSPHVVDDDETKQQVSDAIDDDETKKPISDVVVDDDAKRLVSSMNRLSPFTPHDNNAVDRTGPIVPNISKFNCNEKKVDDYMDSQPEIRAISRMRVVDNLIITHYKMDLTNETLHLTINIVDRFLSAETISSKDLDCVGVTAMFIALKYSELEYYDVEDIVANCCCTKEEIEIMETRILRRLRWKLHVPTPYFFLKWFLKPFENMETIKENMVCFYAELGMLNYAIVIKFSPSIVAAAALYAACASSDKSHMWSQILEMKRDLNEMQVFECAKMMVEIHLFLIDDEERNWHIYGKYPSGTQGDVTLLLAAA